MRFCGSRELFWDFDASDLQNLGIIQNLGLNRIIRSYSVGAFFKTHRLSEDFVTLSTERCPFSAWFPTSKKSTSATFPPTFPNRSPHTKPHHFPPFRGILRTRRPQSNPLRIPGYLPFQGEPTQTNSQANPHSFPWPSPLPAEIYRAVLEQNIAIFAKIQDFLVRVLAYRSVRLGGIFGAN